MSPTFNLLSMNCYSLLSSPYWFVPRISLKFSHVSLSLQPSYYPCL